MAFAQAKTSFLLEQPWRESGWNRGAGPRCAAEAVPPREPCLAGLLFVSSTPAPCEAHLFEALEPRLCSPLWNTYRAQFPRIAVFLPEAWPSAVVWRLEKALE